MIRSLAYNPPPHTALDILYRDDHLIVVNKPSGLLSVPGKGIEKSDCMLSRLQAEFPGVQTVHRLDMPTSGIIIYALTNEAQRSLSIMFEKKFMQKQYIANVFGEIRIKKDTISQPLITDWPNRPRQKIDYKSGKPSITKYELLSIDKDNNSIVRLIPVTGRSHQLRVHMSSIGHPILGDELYGISQSRNFSTRLLLHSEKISFEHPVTGKRIVIECPADFT